MANFFNSQIATVYGRLLSYVTPHWRVILIAFVAMLFYSGANFFVPFIMRDVMATLDDIGRGGSTLVPVWLLLTFAVRGSTDFVAVYGLG